jgi:hypothetical protein
LVACTLADPNPGGIPTGGQELPKKVNPVARRNREPQVTVAGRLWKPASHGQRVDHPFEWADVVRTQIPLQGIR